MKSLSGFMERYHVGFAAGALAGLALGIPAGHALLRDRGESVAARAEPLLPTEPSRGGIATLVDEARRAVRSGHPERALALARDAERLDPENPNIKNNVCAYLGELRRFEEAVTVCQAAVKLQPDFVLARNNLAWVQAERDKAAASASASSTRP
jgi:Flp pilus assembly protein TadD